MPDFKITLSTEAVAKLQVLVARYNSDMKTALTVAEWLDQYVHDAVIAEELAAEAERLRQQADAALQEGVRAARGRLIEAVKGRSS